MLSGARARLAAAMKTSSPLVKEGRRLPGSAVIHVSHKTITSPRAAVAEAGSWGPVGRL